MTSYNDGQISSYTIQLQFSVRSIGFILTSKIKKNTFLLFPDTKKHVTFCTDSSVTSIQIVEMVLILNNIWPKTTVILNILYILYRNKISHFFPTNTAVENSKLSLLDKSKRKLLERNEITVDRFVFHEQNFM